MEINNEEELYVELNELFTHLISLTNQFGKSTVIQNYFFDIFENFLYSTVIQNFFLNLTEENIKENELPADQVPKIKKEFSEIIKEINRDINAPLKNKIDEQYYDDFKSKLKKQFPDFLVLINEIEELFNIKKLKEYLKNKNEEIKLSGKTESNNEEIIVTKAIEIFLNENHFFPDLDDPRFKDILEKNISEISKEIRKKQFPGMWLKKWDIWHSYSSYFLEEINNLDEIAKNLVENDICPMVFNSFGEIWYKDDTNVKKTSLQVEYQNQIPYKFLLPKISNDKYIIEGIIQASQIWAAEKNLFTSQFNYSTPYIRGFLKACYLKKGKRTIALYPQLKLYYNGVVELVFREISPMDFEYYIDLFIENEVNLPKLDFDNIEIPPEIMKSYIRFYYSLYPFKAKFANFIKNKNPIVKFDALVDKKTKIIDTEEFAFNVVPMRLHNEDNQLYLDDLWNQIISAVSYVMNLSNPKYHIKKRNLYNIGDYWTLRPTIYILDYLNQPKSAKEIIPNFQEDLGKIMSRIPKSGSTNFEKFLGKNLREFDDYCLYLNQPLNLLVYSKKGLERFPDPDANHGKLIYEKQAQFESINYFYMSFKRLSNRAIVYDIPLSKILIEQQKLIHLDGLLTEKISPAEEINTIFKYASVKLKWKAIQNATRKELDNRAKIANDKQNRFYRRFSYILTFIFGFGSLSIFTEKVILPFWDYYNLPKIGILELNSAFTILVITLIIVISLLGLLYLAEHKYKKS